MSATVVRTPVMQYRGQDFQYLKDGVHGDLEALEEPSAGKQYRHHKRPQRSSRRRKSKATNHPGYGIAGRRNHRWAW